MYLNSHQLPKKTNINWRDVADCLPTEPFNIFCWIIILAICIQILAVAIFLFEWISPFGFSFQRQPVSEGDVTALGVALLVSVADVYHSACTQ